MSDIQYSDNHKRSLVKTISWRLIATGLTFILTYAWTKDLMLATSLGIGINIIKALVYYIHERIWNKIQWGKTNSSHHGKIQS